MTNSRIVIDPQVHFAQPCVAGTRIPVYAVLELVEADIPFDRIVRDYYPDLSVEDMRACIRYALDIVKSEEVRLAAAD